MNDATVLGELSDTSTPGQGLPVVASPFSEDEVPDQGSVYRTHKVRGTHDQETRKLLALIVLILIGILYCAIFGFYLLGRIDIDHLTAAIAGMSGPQALAAAAIGFYYGSKQG
jgi:hypothetical protein